MGGKGSGGSKRGAAVRAPLPAFIPRDGHCARCYHGEEAAPCTCVVEDRCPNHSDGGIQCIKGAGHRPGSKCVTAAGQFFS